MTRTDSKLSSLTPNSVAQFTGERVNGEEVTIRYTVVSNHLDAEHPFLMLRSSAGRLIAAHLYRDGYFKLTGRRGTSPCTVLRYALLDD